MIRLARLGKRKRGQVHISSNTVTFTYENGRKLTEALTILGQTYTVTSGYDAAGRESSLIYPDGSTVTRTHTNRGQLATISQDGTVVDSRSYDNGGRLISETLGNGLAVTRTYLADNMPASINNSAEGDYAYTWDANKNKTGETVTGAMSDFSSAMTFDNQNRLTAWSRTNGEAQSWQLSPVNDWQSVTTNGATQTRTHGPTHEILTVQNAGSNTPTPIQHDARGSLTLDDLGISRTYDADNKVSQSVVPAGSTKGIPGTHTYHYDALGRRIRKTTGGTAEAGSPTAPADTLFIHAGQQIVADYSLSGSPSGTQPSTLVSRLLWGSYIDELVCQLSTVNNQPSTLYPHRNQQYSTTALTDQSGTVVERYAYTTHGDLKTLDPTTLAPRTTPPLTRYTYTAREHDPETDSYHFRNRDYLPSLARFNTHDPILYPDGWNTYSGWFCTKGSDPRGLIAVDPIFCDVNQKLRDGIEADGRNLWTHLKFYEFFLDPSRWIYAAGFWEVVDLNLSAPWMIDNVRVSAEGQAMQLEVENKIDELAIPACELRRFNYCKTYSGIRGDTFDREVQLTLGRFTVHVGARCKVEPWRKMGANCQATYRCNVKWLLYDEYDFPPYMIMFDLGKPFLITGSWETMAGGIKRKPIPPNGCCCP